MTIFDQSEAATIYECGQCGAQMLPAENALQILWVGDVPFCSEECREAWWGLRPEAVVDQIIDDITEAHRELGKAAKDCRPAFNRWAFGGGK